MYRAVANVEYEKNGDGATIAICRNALNSRLFPCYGLSFCAWCASYEYVCGSVPVYHVVCHGLPTVSRREHDAHRKEHHHILLVTLASRRMIANSGGRFRNDCSQQSLSETEKR